MDRLRAWVKKCMLAFVLLASATSAATGWTWSTSQSCLRRSATDELARAFSDFAHCAVGDTPLGNIPPSVRFRAIELGSSDPSWPDRCKPYEAALRNASARAARFGVDDLEGALPKDESVLVLTFMLDELFSRAASLPRIAPNVSVPSAPPPASLLRPRADALLGDGPLSSSMGRADLYVQLGASTVCWFRAPEGHRVAWCRPTARTATLRGEPSDLVPGEWFDSLVDVEDGVPPTTLRGVESAFVRRDGSSYLLMSGAEMVQRRGTDGRTSLVPLGDMAANDATLELVDGYVMGMRTLSNEAMDEGSLYTCSLTLRSLDANDPRTIELQSTSGCVIEQTCLTDDVMFVWAAGSLVGLDRRSRALKLADSTFANVSSMSCSGDEVFMSWTDGIDAHGSTFGDADLTICRLRPGGLYCMDMGERSLPLVDLSTSAFTTLVSDTSILVREQQGLRVRVARFEELFDAPDRLLLDGDASTDGSEEVADVHLFPRGDHAVLLVEAKKGVLGYVVDASGSVTPITREHL